MRTQAACLIEESGFPAGAEVHTQDTSLLIYFIKYSLLAKKLFVEIYRKLLHSAFYVPSHPLYKVGVSGFLY